MMMIDMFFSSLRFIIFKKNFEEETKVEERSRHELDKKLARSVLSEQPECTLF